MNRQEYLGKIWRFSLKPFALFIGFILLFYVLDNVVSGFRGIKSDLIVYVMAGVGALYFLVELKNYVVKIIPDSVRNNLKAKRFVFNRILLTILIISGVLQAIFLTTNFEISNIYLLYTVNIFLLWGFFKIIHFALEKIIRNGDENLIQ
jgi:hypothetical protein